MKKFIYIFIVLISATLFSSCRINQTNDSEGAAAAELRFDITVPEAKIAGTKAPVEAGMIENLYLLVFDEGGLFLSRHRAEMTTPDGGYKATLPISTGLRRVVHFVCNYDWTGFSDMTSLGKSESELIMSLSVSNPKVAYWQRVEFGTGIDSGTNAGTIVLLRNVAKVSVVNLTTGLKHITNVTFTTGDFYNKGTIAPFNNSTMTFTEGVVTESTSSARVAANELNLAPSGTSSVDLGSSVYCYERRNSTASNPSYIIVKGYFQDGVTANTTIPSYYKIDIVDHGSDELYDIERNYHYILKLNEVTLQGYPTLAEAANAPASNNIESSVLVQQFTSVTDGVSQLNVDYTSRLLVRGGAMVNIGYSFVPNAITGVVDNTGVEVTLDQDPAKPVFVSGTFSYVATASNPGIISGVTAPLPSIGSVHTATVTISKGNLQRRVTLRLRQPLDLQNVYTSPNPVADIPGQPVELRFTIPSAVSESEFPMPIYISTKKLSPNVSVDEGSELVLDVSNGEYRYIYYAQAPGEQIIYLKTNSVDSDETITVDSDLTNAVAHIQTTVQLPLLQSLSFTPDGASLYQSAGTAVAMTFNIPSVAGVNPPYVISIQTSKLNFVNSPTGSVVAISGGYRYTTNSSGVQTINFRTNTALSDEYVIVSEPRYASIGYQRTSTPMSFVDMRFAPNPVLKRANVPISLKLGVPSFYNFPANGGECLINIYTSQLVPADGNPSGLQPISDPIYGSGYRYRTTVGGNLNVSFKTLTNNTNESITITSTGFYNANAVVSSVTAYSFVTATFDTKPRNISNKTTVMTLRIEVPEGTEPVTVRINSQDVLVAQPTNQVGLVRVGNFDDQAGYYNYAISTPGVYNVTFVNRTTNTTVRRRTITLSAPDFVTTANINN